MLPTESDFMIEQNTSEDKNFNDIHEAVFLDEVIATCSSTRSRKYSYCALLLTSDRTLVGRTTS